MSETSLNADLLVNLAHRGVAERINEEVRKEIHLKTKLDEFIEEKLEEGKQIVLTGNPGDGKTQYIYMMEEKYPEAFYIYDASEYNDNVELLKNWEEKLQEEKRGILAINDGPLYEMITNHEEDYDFLTNVREQVENQVVIDSSPDLDFSDLIVINLSNRNVLAPNVVIQAMNLLDREGFKENHDHEKKCHIQENLERISEAEDSFKKILKELGRLDEHFTVRDLLNFLAHCVTGGRTCETEFGESLRYYNLAFEGDNNISEALRENFGPLKHTHPFIDQELWARAEENTRFGDQDYDKESVLEEFEKIKRRFYFESEEMGTEFNRSDLYNYINREFRDLVNGNNGFSENGKKRRVIRKLNSYFRPENAREEQLRLWFSHNYHSSESKVIVSDRTEPEHKFEFQVPQLHSKISDAIDYVPEYYVLRWKNEEKEANLVVDKNLDQSLNILDSNIPYILRSDEEERRILAFMEKIEGKQNEERSSGEIMILDTETGKTETIRVDRETYSVS